MKTNKDHPFIPTLEVTLKNTRFEFQDTDPKYPLKSKVSLPQLKAKLHDSELYLQSAAKKTTPELEETLELK